MTRQEAYEILIKYLTNKALLKHSLATEITMKKLAKHFGEDEELWGVVGLLHDADYQLAKGHPEHHAKLLFEKEPNIPEEIATPIKAHNATHTKVKPKDKIDWALICCDDLTGLIVAATNVYTSKKIEDVKVDFIMNKLKQKDFIHRLDRTNIYLCNEKLKIPLIEFVSITLNAMQAIHKELEL